MITKEECFKKLREIIDVTISTVDTNGNPQSRIIDIMHNNSDTIYFLTARGKNFYKELENNPHISILGLKDNKTIRIETKAKKLADQKKWIDLMFEKNPIMNNVYPDKSRYILEPFCITSGKIEYFDLTQHPIYRKTILLNNTDPIVKTGYEINNKCTIIYRFYQY